MSIPTIRRRLPAHIPAVLVGVLLFAAAVPAGADLLARAQGLGSVKVIVDLRAAPAADQSLGGGLPGAVQQRIRSIQDRVLGRLQAAGIGRVRRFAFTPQMAMRVSATQLIALRQDSDVVAVHEDKLNKPLLGQSVPLIFPDHLTSPYTGAGWVVAVLDTGVDKTHPFLQGPTGSKVLSEACYSDAGGDPNTFSVCPGGGFQSTAPGSGVPCNVAGCEHGTHVAGIAVGEGSDDGTYLTGVARQGRLIAIQVFSGYDNPGFCYPESSPCAVAWDSDIMAGLQRVYALRSTFNIAAVNLSLGGGAYTGFCDTDPLKQSIDQLKSAGIATVVAAGNGDIYGKGYPDKLSAPACISSAIAVGSTTDTGPGSTSGVKDTRSTYSNNGVALDLYAPGEIITSSIPGGGFADYRGTSMATPHVAGAFAVLRSENPNASVDTLLAAFEATGKPISYAGITRRRIDVQQALDRFASPRSPPTRRSSIAPILELLLDD